MNKKDSVTKFDFNDAFRALDELDYPQYTAKDLKPKQPIAESIIKNRGNRSGFKKLFEEAYNVYDKAELEKAEEDRAAEVAKAKLDRIEKIVDLDADAVEDLLDSYVGKLIIQCPQCKTLFYKKEEDIERTEDNPDIVDVNETCQHCGNTSGYEVIGKVAEETVATPTTEEVETEEAAETGSELDLDFDNLDEISAEETAIEETAEETPTEEIATEEKAVEEEEVAEETSAEEEAEEEEEEEETKKKEESLDKKSLKESDAPAATSIEDAQKWVDYDMERYHKISDETNELVRKAGYQIVKDDHGEYEVIAGEYEESLQEAVDTDLDKKLAEHNKYIEYLQEKIKDEEEALKKATNEEVKATIQKCLDALQEELKNALPEAVKNEVEADDLPTAEEAGIDEVTEETVEEESVQESLNESRKARAKRKSLGEPLAEAISAKNALDRVKAAFSEATEMKEAVSAKDALAALEARFSENLTEANVFSKAWQGIKNAATAVKDNVFGGTDKKINKKYTVFSVVPGSIVAQKFTKAGGVKTQPTIEKAIELATKLSKADNGRQLWRVVAGEIAGDSDKALFNNRAVDFRAGKKTGDYTKQLAASIDADAMTQPSTDTTEVRIEEPKVKDQAEFSTNTDTTVATVEASAEEETTGKPTTSKGDKLNRQIKNNKVIAKALADAGFNVDDLYVKVTRKDGKPGKKASDKLNALRKALFNEEFDEDEIIEDEKAIENPETEEAVEDIVESSFNNGITKYLKEVYDNVEDFEMTDCRLEDDKLICEGKINFASGKSKNTIFEFKQKRATGNNKIIFEGLNKDFSNKTAFAAKVSVRDKAYFLEEFKYQYKINESLVKGHIKG